MAPRHATVWFDGASRGNPGPSAGGAVVDIDGRRAVLHGHVRTGTNNEAEYEGLILGLRHALDEEADSVEVRGDSQLVLRQLEGVYKVKADHLRPLWREARTLLSRFASSRLVWVRREQNTDADAAANAALDA